MKRSRSIGVAPGVVEIGNFLKVIGTLGDKEECAVVARVQFMLWYRTRGADNVDGCTQVQAQGTSTRSNK